MNNNVKLALIVATAVLLFASGWVVREWYENSVQLQIDRVKDEFSLVAAEQIAKIKIENKTTYAKTVERIKTDIVYSECKADQETMRLTNEVLKWK